MNLVRKNVRFVVACRALICGALILSFAGIACAQSVDTPEQTQQYRYALGLVQRHLHDEAIRVLDRLLSDPAPFSQRDGATFWLAECYYRRNEFPKAIGLYSQLLRAFPTSTFRDRAAYGLGWAHTKNNNPKVSHRRVHPGHQGRSQALDRFAAQDGRFDGQVSNES
jgi:tetratricopeptide (TPR) repeat protein